MITHAAAAKIAFQLLLVLGAEVHRDQSDARMDTSALECKIQRFTNLAGGEAEMKRLVGDKINKLSPVDDESDEIGIDKTLAEVWDKDCKDFTF